MLNEPVRYHTPHPLKTSYRHLREEFFLNWMIPNLKQGIDSTHLESAFQFFTPCKRYRICLHRHVPSQNTVSFYGRGLPLDSLPSKVGIACVRRSGADEHRVMPVHRPNNIGVVCWGRPRIRLSIFLFGIPASQSTSPCILDGLRDKGDCSGAGAMPTSTRNSEGIPGQNRCMGCGASLYLNLPNGLQLKITVMKGVPGVRHLLEPPRGEGTIGLDPRPTEEARVYGLLGVLFRLFCPWSDLIHEKSNGAVNALYFL